MFTFKSLRLRGSPKKYVSRLAENEIHEDIGENESSHHMHMCVLIRACVRAFVRVSIHSVSLDQAYTYFTTPSRSISLLDTKSKTLAYGLTEARSPGVMEEQTR